MRLYSDKERWHSAQCHLCVTGGHHRNMCGTGAHSPLGCALVFSNRTGGSVLYNRGKAMCIMQCHKGNRIVDKPIAIWAMAPLEHHIRPCIAAVGEDPSKPQSPPSEGESESHSPTGNPHLGGRTLCHLQTELDDLADQELYQPV